MLRIPFLTKNKEIDRNFTAIQVWGQQVDSTLKDGVDGSFTSQDGKTVTVENGIITSIT